MNVKRIVMFSVCAGIILFHASADAAEPIDAYVARVNSRVITLGEVMTYMQPVLRQLLLKTDRQELAEALDEAFNETRDSLVEKALIVEEFATLEQAYVPEEAVDDEIETLIRKRYNNDRSELLRVLAEGRVTWEEFREMQRENVIIEMMRRDKIVSQLMLSPGRVRTMYDARLDEFRTPEQVKLSMIALQQGTSEEERKLKREEAEQILRELESGADFAVLAKLYSEDRRARDGGAWGWVEPADLRAELAEALKDMHAGTVGPLIQAGDQLYIVKLEARRKAGVRPFEEVRSSIAEELRVAQAEQLHKAWIRELKRNHYVEYIPPPAPMLELLR